MPGELVIPWVAAWTGEHEATGLVWYDSEGVKSDMPDATGKFYWMPTPNLPGVGRPMFGQVHPIRQSRCMRGKRCQVCGRKMDVATWILPSAVDSDFQAASIYTPPTCLPCIRTALRLCPHLQVFHSQVVYRVPHFHVAGVYGSVYTGVDDWSDDYVELRDQRRLAATIAKDLVVQWDEWEEIPLGCTEP